MEKDKIIIRNCDNIEIDSILYLIPERYTTAMNIGVEYKCLFNYILAHVIHNNIQTDGLDIESLNKTHYDKYLVVTERIFAFIITGKLDNVVFSGYENKIIECVPNYIIPKLNPMIVERH